MKLRRAAVPILRPYLVEINVFGRRKPWGAYARLDDAKDQVSKLRGHGFDAEVVTTKPPQ